MQDEAAGEVPVAFVVKSNGSKISEEDIKQYISSRQQWYVLSKTLAEEAAWKFSKEEGLDMVAINPAMVIGPLLQPTLNTSAGHIRLINRFHCCIPWNIGNVPLVLIAALCRDKSNPFGDSEKCSTDGTAYISFGQWVGAIILYTYVFNMLSPPPEGTFDIEDENLPIKNLTKDGTPDQVPLLTQEEAASTNSNDLHKGKIKDFFAFLYEKLKLKQILQPPIIASILAMVLGAVPFLKRLIFAADAPLFFFTDSCIILGEAMIPCILLALGGNLVDGPGSSKLGLRTTAAIIFGRLVLVPPVGLGIVTLADYLGFLLRVR
ncbi:Tetraketide alpha-pyrone reductase 1 [Morella rubra]|uniref:Tetraketide alpha-pyrone reductase 1 n=1 Tax=Morella rubra TaxID=262757 RepID=A0A6A1WM74_9ROSI|nr:Tetraketide alpha-pyrone reductase 1 [Morella rubra]